MIRRVICQQCGSECEYNDKSVREGCREFEDFRCPECGFILDTVFTDQSPYVRLIKKGDASKK